MIVSPVKRAIKPLSARDIRPVNANDIIVYQSTDKIVTRLCSTEFIKTTVLITETECFEDEVVKHPLKECGSEPYVFVITPAMSDSKFAFLVTQIDVATDLTTDTLEFTVEAGASDIRNTGAHDIIVEQTIKKIVTRLCSTKFIKTSVMITETKRFDDEVVKHPLKECGSEPYVFLIKPEMFGSKFIFHVSQVDIATNLNKEFEFTAEAVLSRAEMGTFMENIEFMVDESSMMPTRFYRVNDWRDDDRCKEHNGGCYEHMRKMKSGHQASPLYGQINVTYFSCRPEDDGSLPAESYFGRNLRAFPVDKILNKSSVAFLGGMHCYLGRNREGQQRRERHKRPHYPSIVVCQRDSITFHTCTRLGLKLLDWATNNFLRWNQETGELLCATKLRKLENMGSFYWPHDTYVEIMLADTSVRIADGQQRWCIPKYSNSKHKSCLECTVCNGWMGLDKIDCDVKKEETAKPPLKRNAQNISDHFLPTKRSL